jgi:hypothetical protein
MMRAVLVVLALCLCLGRPASANEYFPSPRLPDPPRLMIDRDPVCRGLLARVTAAYLGEQPGMPLTGIDVPGQEWERLEWDERPFEWVPDSMNPITARRRLPPGEGGERDLLAIREADVSTAYLLPPGDGADSPASVQVASWQGGTAFPEILRPAGQDRLYLAYGGDTVTLVPLEEGGEGAPACLVRFYPALEEMGTTSPDSLMGKYQGLIDAATTCRYRAGAWAIRWSYGSDFGDFMVRPWVFAAPPRTRLWGRVQYRDLFSYAAYREISLGIDVLLAKHYAETFGYPPETASRLAADVLRRIEERALAADNPGSHPSETEAADRAREEAFIDRLFDGAPREAIEAALAARTGSLSQIGADVPLSFALAHPEVVALLLEAGMPPDAPEDVPTPLMHAARGDHLEAARLLVAAGADIDAYYAKWDCYDMSESTALEQAAHHASREMIEFLLDSGATLLPPESWTDHDIAALMEENPKLTPEDRAAILARLGR